MTNYKEIPYTEELWDILFPLAVHKGSSLHCDEWSVEYEGKSYRLFECGTVIRSIEIED